VALVEQDVPIRYGLIMQQDDFWEAESTSFPHADEPVMGGCVVTDNMPYGARALVCPACCKARDAWREAHPYP